MASKRRSTKNNRVVARSISKKLPFSFNSPLALVVVACVAFIGGYFLYKSFALTNYQLYQYPLVDNTALGSMKLLSDSGKLMERGSVSGYLYWDTGSAANQYKLHLHDTSSGQTTNIVLPTATPGHVLLWAQDGTLWTLGNQASVAGMLIQHFALNGGPLPTSASLLGQYTFGNSDSRYDDIMQLASGAVVALYHQQGGNGAPQSDTVLYLAPGSSAWQSIPLSFEITKASKARLVQQPADKSIWFFRNADATGVISATHLTENNGNLHVDWTNNTFQSNLDELNAPDPENPDLEVATDPVAGDILLAYQSTDRKVLTKGTTSQYGVDFINESYPVVMHLKADQSKTYTKLPVYVERISQMALISRSGEMWLAYRPVDQATYNFSKAYASLYRNGVWEPAIYLGSLVLDSSFTNGSWANLIGGISRPEFVTTLQDANNATYGQVNFLSMLSAGTLDISPPTVTVAAPGSGATLNGTVNAEVTAADNVGVTKVEFMVDGVVKQTLQDTPYSWAWDTSQIADGQHTLQAKAYDAAGNSSLSQTVTVTTSNTVTPPPTADTTPPTAPSGLQATNVTATSLQLNWAASTDNTGVSGYKLYQVLNGRKGSSTALLASLIGSAISDKVTGLSPATSYSFYVIATDAAGNNSQPSNTVTIKTLRK